MTSRASTPGALSSATATTPLTRAWKSSLRATKSVSELTSTTTPRLALTATPTRPSAATRPLFLAALARPFLRSQSTAASMSPSDLVQRVLAVHHARAGLLAQILHQPSGDRRHGVPSDASNRCVRWTERARPEQALGPSPPRPGPIALMRERERYSPRPSARAACSPHLSRAMRPLNLRSASSLAASLRRHRGELPVVEHAMLVELLDDLRTDAGQLGEIVGRAARRGRAARNGRSSRPRAPRVSGSGSATGASASPRSAPWAPWPREMPSIAARAMRSQ